MVPVRSYFETGFILYVTNSKPSFYVNNFNLFLSKEQNHFVFNNLAGNEGKGAI